MEGVEITIAATDGGTIPSYLSTPSSGHGVGVIVIPTILGAEPYMISFADRLAAEGFGQERAA